MNIKEEKKDKLWVNNRLHVNKFGFEFWQFVLIFQDWKFFKENHMQTDQKVCVWEQHICAPFPKKKRSLPPLF